MEWKRLLCFMSLLSHDSQKQWMNVTLKCNIWNQERVIVLIKQYTHLLIWHWWYVGDDCLQSQSLKQRVCVFCSLLNLCNRLSLFLLSLIQHNWSDRFLHALDVSISSWQHALSLFVSGQPRPQLDQSNPAAFCLAFCVTEHLSLCCNSIHFDNLAPKLSGWFLILHTALLICKHHTKATGEHIIIQRTSSQTDAVEPCDVGLINDMDWRAPAVGYVGQAN